MILYFGNILSGTGNVPSFIELFIPKIREIFPVIGASTKRNKVMRLADMVLTMIRYNRRASVVLIDTYSYQGFYFAFVMGVLSHLFSVPYIPIVHGGDFAKRIKRSPRLTAFFFRRAARIVAPSRYICELLEAHDVTPQYLPNFIEISEYPFKERGQVKPHLLWVRSFHRIYNPMLAIEFVQLLRAKFPSIRLTMVGPDKDGSLAFCKTMVVERGLEEHVSFTGKLSKPEIRLLATSHDIFINTTTIDNHPVSVIEAMALGLVVISTNVGGIPYFVSDGEDGLLVPSGDAAAFASAVEMLLASSDLSAKLQCNARKKVEDYDWSEAKQKWIKLLSPFFK